MRDEHTKGRREGGANTEDWQKQSSSTVWCLNLHCLRYTPVTHHRSTLMTSNLTQGFGIGPTATPALVSGMRVILIRCILQLYLQEVMMCCGHDVLWATAMIEGKHPSSQTASQLLEFSWTGSVWQTNTIFLSYYLTHTFMLLFVFRPEVNQCRTAFRKPQAPCVKWSNYVQPSEEVHQ